MHGIDYWRLADELTIVQAALLTCGYDPTEYQEDLRYNEKNAPAGYPAIRHAIASAVKTETLSKRETMILDQRSGEYYPDDNLALVNVSELKIWLSSKGIREHFFFFPEEPEGAFLSKKHPRYSPKLAAAVRAWQALEDKALHTKTAKQSVKKWLRLHSTEYDLTDDEGKPMETAIDEIAKIVNWNPKGGAPLTPSGSGLDKPTVKNETKGRFAILSEKKKTDLNEFDLLDDPKIPF